MNFGTQGLKPLIIICLIFAFSNPALALESKTQGVGIWEFCHPTPIETVAIIELYAVCDRNGLHCSKDFDYNGKTITFDGDQFVGLIVSELSVSYNSSSNRGDIKLAFDLNYPNYSKECLKEFSKVHVNTSVAVVSHGQIISIAQLNETISNGRITLSTSFNENYDNAVKQCQAISEKCIVLNNQFLVSIEEYLAKFVNPIRRWMETLFEKKSLLEQ